MITLLKLMLYVIKYVYVIILWGESPLDIYSINANQYSFSRTVSVGRKALEVYAILIKNGRLL